MSLPTQHREDPVAKAIAMLDMLPEETREHVLQKMDPRLRQRIEERLETMPEGTRGNDAFSKDIAARRRLVRMTAEAVYADRMRRVQEAIAADGAAATLPRSVPEGTPTAQLFDPLAELKHVHPAAIARAMQGERAEAWAIVLDRLEDHTRAALELYLDADALASIAQARTRQADLRQNSPAIAATIEKAIARTVVPLALREHRMLMTPPSHPVPGVTYGSAL